METMRGAVLLGPEEIQVQDIPVPRPGPGELLNPRLHAAQM